MTVVPLRYCVIADQPSRRVEVTVQTLHQMRPKSYIVTTQGKGEEKTIAVGASPVNAPMKFRDSTLMWAGEFEKMLSPGDGGYLQCKDVLVTMLDAPGADEVPDVLVCVASLQILSQMVAHMAEESNFPPWMATEMSRINKAMGIE